MKTHKFYAEIEGDVLSGETYPIYDDELNKLLGAFTLDSDYTIAGFVSGLDHPAALLVSIGDPFFFTPREDVNGKVSYGVISELSVSPLSVKIYKTF